MPMDIVKNYKVLLEINNAIINKYSREDLFQSLAKEILKIFHYDRFSINLFNSESNTLSYFASAEGIKLEGINGNKRNLEKGSISYLVIKSRKPLFIDDISQKPPWLTLKYLIKTDLKVIMAFPMVIRDRILGSIHFCFKEMPPNHFEIRKFLNALSVQVAIAVDNMLAHEKLNATRKKLETEKSYLLENIRNYHQFQKESFFYKSQSIKNIINEIEILSETDASILITGETGTGKGHISRYIHNLSPRKENMFIDVNCANLSPSLIESELFGHVKGAYTGADKKRIGRFEMADNGTILLDEISEIPLKIQAKLLGVLENKTLERVGESNPISVNFRLIATTNQNLERMIADKTFRRDLFYRINVYQIHMPALRERTEDIPLLVSIFCNKYAEKIRRTEARYASSAIKEMCRYSWPGNVRELKNVVERLSISHSGKLVTGSDITAILRTLGDGAKINFYTRDEMEKKHIMEAIRHCNGVIGGKHGAAKLLGIPRTTLQYRLKKLGL
jgi:transcriptional regulator with GAF, ATPase, and Fis domain